jgi:hypothetical protein
MKGMRNVPVDAFQMGRATESEVNRFVAQV